MIKIAVMFLNNIKILALHLMIMTARGVLFVIFFRLITAAPKLGFSISRIILINKLQCCSFTCALFDKLKTTAIEIKQFVV